MSKRHHPKRGSMGYSPRKRARRENPRMKSWLEGGNEPMLQGFAGYKAGMSHALVVDYRPTSTTSGQEVQIPVSVIETPPMIVAAIRGYEKTPYGLKTSGERWATDLDEELKRRIPIPKEAEEDFEEKDEEKEIEEIRAICHTQPIKITGVPKKAPDIMEIPIRGGSIDKRIEYGKKILGKEIEVEKVFKEGEMLDIAGVTKGKGFQGHIKRWGVKLLTHKNSKHRRMIGTLGPWHPSWVRPTIPQAGQMGYHHRTEYNKRLLKIGEGEEITPDGGFPHYGIVRETYLLIHGSIPGPRKRLVQMRKAIRYGKGVEVEKPEITYISTTSKQGK